MDEDGDVSVKQKTEESDETSSEEEPPTSEMGSLDEDEQADQAAENYADAVMERDEKHQINFDHYLFSVAQKYDLTNRRLTFKKIKYIQDELFLDLKLRMYKELQF